MIDDLLKNIQDLTSIIIYKKNMSLSEQIHIDDRLDKFKTGNSAQRQKEKAELMRNYFKIPDKFSDKQVLAKEKQIRKAYHK